MPPGRSSCALAILLALLDLQSGGCMRITSSASQEGARLNFTCTLWHEGEEAEGVILFLCKDRSGDCSPETSLEQLRPRRDPGIEGVSAESSQLVFTINRATPLDSGTYQCCARSRKPEVHLQGHFFSVLIPETRNYTAVTELKPRHLDFSGGDRALSLGFLMAKVLGMLVSDLVVLQVL